MRIVSLRFPTILELVDFNSIIEKDDYQVDHLNLTIKGKFEEADIELARAGYKAIVTEEPPA